ncbi:MAG: hypothetical protein II999_10325 [Bacteroidaceae bacterium]|nr:hypothetical protein [Bacteroidaceae bacterium]
MKTKIQTIVIISIILLTSNILDCNLISPLVFKVVRFPIIAVLCFLLLKRHNWKQKRMLFAKDIKWTMIVPCLSWISAILIWGQSPFASFVACAQIYIFLLYFFCFAYDVSEQILLKIFASFTIVVFLIQIYEQFITSPPFLFGGIDGEYGWIKRGLVYRISILTNITIIVLFYYWIKLLRGENKYISLFFFVVGLMLAYFSCTRQIIIATLIGLIYAAIKNSRRRKGAILIIGMCVVLLYAYGGFLFESLLELSKSQMEEDSFGGRNDSYAFYWNKIVTEPLTFLLGSGKAYGGEYERVMFSWTDAQKHILVDIGHIGEWFLFGIGYMIVFFTMQYKLLIKYRKYLSDYLVCYFLYINIIGFMIAPYANMELICATALGYYLADKDIQKNKMRSLAQQYNEPHTFIH